MNATIDIEATQAKAPKPTKSKALCSGCYNDVYNHGCGGAKECWSFAKATVEKRLMIPVDLRPPYKFPPRWVLSCYRPQRVCNVKPEAINEEGFWKS
jgi:hypothetical protein